MDPTLRRTVVQFQAASDVRHATTNESRRTWSNTGSEKFGQLSGRFAKEKDVAGSQESSITHDLRMNFYDLVGITAAHRVVIESTVFEIVGIVRDFEMHGDSIVKLMQTDTPVS